MLGPITLCSMRDARSAGPVLALLLAFAACSAPPPAEEEPRLPVLAWPASGPLVVTGSGTLPAGMRLQPAGDSGAVLLEDLTDVELDLTGLVLRGAEPGTDPDRMGGYGIVVRRCANVVLRGGQLSGYRGALVIEDSCDVRVEGLVCDDNFRQRLGSTPAAEDLADWLRPHENDAGEWLARYGAAISVTDSERVEVFGCRARRGQNGLLLTRSNECTVRENDFSFLSGWGAALYRSSANQLVHNRFDYCVRGFSPGVYWRGQDSAGILLFERSSENVVAWNSATHGGDGLFLFGGNDLVEGRAAERGEAEVGGSDGNLFFRNDFSFAVANAWEGTFSRDNAVLENRLGGSLQHGLWGGYSSRLRVEGNWIEANRGPGIAVEHGQDLWLADNVLRDNATGIALWWDADPAFVDGPFGRARETSSARSWILGNDFERNGRDLDLLHTREVVLASNRYLQEVGSAPPELELVSVSTRVEGRDVDWEEWLPTATDAAGRRPGGRLEDVDFALWDGREPRALEDVLARSPERVPGPRAAWKPTLRSPGGVETIVMGEWGPWDFESGAPRPTPLAAGGLLAESRWSARWFDWSGGPDPRENPAGWRALAEGALLFAAEELPVWTSPWPPVALEVEGEAERENGTARRVAERSRVGLLAVSEFSLADDAGAEAAPTGPDGARRYRLEVLSDDGVRVWLDGEVVLENWTWHAPTKDAVELWIGPGSHRWELEYFQIDGAAALAIALRALPPGAGDDEQRR